MSSTAKYPPDTNNADEERHVKFDLTRDLSLEPYFESKENSTKTDDVAIKMTDK